jgi:hypothetical protein
MYTKSNKTEIATRNDSVMTDELLAKWIIGYFKPKGVVLEPARGTGNFYRHLSQPKDWCEIDEGRDFLKYRKKADWIITNPPYSIYDIFLTKCLEVADNIVFLIPLQKVFKSKKIDSAIEKYGGIKEIVMLGGGGSVGFPFGFPVGAVYYKRGYKGDIKLTRQYATTNRKSVQNKRRK